MVATLHAELATRLMMHLLFLLIIVIFLLVSQ